MFRKFGGRSSDALSVVSFESFEQNSVHINHSVFDKCDSRRSILHLGSAVLYLLGVIVWCDILSWGLVHCGGCVNSEYQMKCILVYLKYVHFIFHAQLDQFIFIHNQTVLCIPSVWKLLNGLLSYLQERSSSIIEDEIQQLSRPAGQGLSI